MSLLIKALEQAAKERDRSFHDALPLHASMFAEELAKHLPPDAIIFDEALTTSPELTRYITPTAPGSYFLTRGGSLGVGIPGAIGIKIANPDKVVFGFTGDGGSMYTIQALWTAAKYGVAAKFVVLRARPHFSEADIKKVVTKHLEAAGMSEGIMHLIDEARSVYLYDKMPADKRQISGGSASSARRPRCRPPAGARAGSGYTARRGRAWDA